jgi:uncharacterized protein (TIGR04255 family)
MFMSPAQPHYKKNYLKQVLFRIDFTLNELGGFDEFKEKLREYHVARFDNVEKRQLKVTNLTVDSNSIVNELGEREVWFLESTESGNKLNITTDSCVLEYSTYANATYLITDIENYINTFLNMHQIKEAKRIGLRYINEVNPVGIKKVNDWTTYVHDDLLAYDAFSLSGKTLTRVLNHVEFKADDVNVAFQYGIWNNKYPSPITNSPFILDIDCSTRLPVDLEDKNPSDYAQLLSNKASELFEEVIKDKLRNDMEKI